MQRTARLGLAIAALAAFVSPAVVNAQTAVEPYKVGTFNINGQKTLGLVLRDQFIVDIAAANQAMATGRIQAPAHMIELIERYDSGVRARLVQITNDLVQNNRLTGSGRPAYVHDVRNVDILAPMTDPWPSKIMNAAVNFYTHACEGCTPEELAAQTRERQTNRGVPYLFLKPTRGAIIGDGDEIILPYGRDDIEWEIEFATVFGREGKYISARRAYDYVFGYMAGMDISDRGGRPPGGFGSGSDWFVGKGHDTFAPQGPWIVPKEFFGDPMQNLHQQLVIDGVTVQEARAGDMIHSIPELIEYASSLITIYPGDVLQSGTSGGTGAGRVQRATGSGFLVDGETITGTVTGIGSLTHRVRRETSVPSDLSGAQLTPNAQYRGRGGRGGAAAPAGGGRGGN
jgi:2-keto-4-pentenoate hydratase/2-oxohepta-3-ene-1,7-dioic acid hydratase in catechol pathway